MIFMYFLSSTKYKYRDLAVLATKSYYYGTDIPWQVCCMESWTQSIVLVAFCLLCSSNCSPVDR